MVKIETLYNLLTCKVYTDLAKRTLYATDASDYKEMPLAVVFPENQNDINFSFAQMTAIGDTSGSDLLTGYFSTLLIYNFDDFE